MSGSVSAFRTEGLPGLQGSPGKLGKQDREMASSLRLLTQANTDSGGLEPPKLVSLFTCYVKFLRCFKGDDYQRKTE